MFRPQFLFKRNLALAYFPQAGSADVARHTLMNLIESDSKLMQQLLDTGYNRSHRQFTPRQVQLIINRLGNPF